MWRTRQATGASKWSKYPDSAKPSPAKKIAKITFEEFENMTGEVLGE